jgi:hypothetical protein
MGIFDFFRRTTPTTIQEAAIILSPVSPGVELSKESFNRVELLDFIWDPAISPEEENLKSQILRDLTAVIEKNRMPLGEGLPVSLRVEPFLREALITAIDGELGREWYLFESRKSGIGADSQGLFQIPKGSELVLVHLPAVVSLCEENLREAISKHAHELEEGAPIFVQPFIEVGRELCTLFQNRLGSEYTLGETLLPSGEIVYAISRVIDEQERARRSQFIPMGSAWLTAKAL